MVFVFPGLVLYGSVVTIVVEPVQVVVVMTTTFPLARGSFEGEDVQPHVIGEDLATVSLAHK